MPDRATGLVKRYDGSVADVYGAAPTGFSATMSATRGVRLFAVKVLDCSGSANANACYHSPGGPHPCPPRRVPS
ncbi:hypothetical protein [Micromonospora halophytica]|uniref:Uncharacterized protein n=1 Tax=Micromonospora halophytica TaxID=47864 RepID=A0A1C5I1K7_9ACTN|nr:hypothetical protein [Micromonospora halophytica]SCG52124.1 hypothetical protein GA0070560_107118 [Micromonospora halophytica]